MYRQPFLCAKILNMLFFSSKFSHQSLNCLNISMLSVYFPRVGVYQHLFHRITHGNRSIFQNHSGTQERGLKGCKIQTIPVDQGPSLLQNSVPLALWRFRRNIFAWLCEDVRRQTILFVSVFLVLTKTISRTKFNESGLKLPNHFVAGDGPYCKGLISLIFGALHEHVNIFI